MPAPLLAELGALRAELDKPKPAAPPAPRGEASPPAPEGLDHDLDLNVDLEKILADLRDLLGDVGDSAEGLIAQNPIAAVSAAFVLGFAAGRLTGQGTKR